MTKALQDDRQQPFIWLHLALDDLDIELAAKGLYLHIVRRAGRNGQCWESLEHMAHCCRTSVGTIKRLLRKLIGYNLIKRLPRAGMTTIYRLTDAEEWTCHKIQPFKRDSSKLTRAQTDLGQEPPGSDPTHLPGSDPTYPPGSDSTYKIDPSELDPNELDPHSLRASESGNSIASEPEPEFEQEQPEYLAKSSTAVHSIRETAKPIVQDSSSASPKFSLNVSNAVPQSDRQLRVPWGSLNRPEPAFLEYLQKHYLPSVPCYQGKLITLSMAKSWLSEAAFREDRFVKASIQYDAYREDRKQRAQHSSITLAQFSRLEPKPDRLPDLTTPTAIAAMEAMRQTCKAVRAKLYGS